MATAAPTVPAEEKRETPPDELPDAAPEAAALPETVAELEAEASPLVMLEEVPAEIG